MELLLLLLILLHVFSASLPVSAGYRGSTYTQVTGGFCELFSGNFYANSGQCVYDGNEYVILQCSSNLSFNGTTYSDINCNTPTGSFKGTQGSCATVLLGGVNEGFHIDCNDGMRKHYSTG